MSDELENQLITDAKDGSLAAFEKLYRAHVGRVHGLCVRLCDDPADAQDATQEAFIKAWRALQNFRGESSFSTWLHRIAFNAAVGLQRRKKPQESPLHVVSESSAESASSLTEVEQLEHALSRLPNRAREAIVLHRIYGYTHEETAQFMGTSVGASKAQVHRAQNLLKDFLGDQSASGMQQHVVASDSGALND